MYDTPNRDFASTSILFVALSDDEAIVQELIDGFANTLATGAKFIGDTFNSPLCCTSTIPTGRPLLMESRIAAYILVGRLSQHSVDL